MVMVCFHFDAPTVVFGNSLVRQLAPHVRDRRTGMEPVMVGVPGGMVDAAANDLLRTTLAPTRRNPGAAAAAVVIISGCNDVPTDRTTREILEGMLELVDTAAGARRGRRRRRRVVVANLASNGDDDDARWRAKRLEYNRLLAEASEAHPFEVLDVDGIGPELSEDGIHYTKAGYVALAAAMARALDDGGKAIDGPSPERHEETSDAELGEGRRKKRRL